MAIRCPKCQFENLVDTRFCGNCAAPLHPSEKIPVSITETLQAPLKDLSTGSTFAGRYQIIEELGKGGMGKVYRVLDKKLNEEVALKLIRPEVASDRQTIERFSNELKLARKITHRNVGRMYELMEDEGTHFITMEYVPGENLKSTIRRIGQLPVAKSMAIARQICDGLAEAHRLGVVHRDLKPSNIILDSEGNARIMDFGIARSVHTKGITGAGVMIGTPEYMSPEQVEGKEADRRSDIYSLGIILYEMVTGRVPFEGDTPLSTAHKQKYEPPQPPGEVNAQIPEDLSDLILHCLEKDKEKRYQTAEEVNSNLAKIESEIPTAERAIPKRKPARSREVVAGGAKIKWKKVVLYACAVVILALIICASLILFSGRKEVIDSIAVLPFENVNADPNTEFLCDGITETIINKLSQLSGFEKVISRNSVFAYKGKTVDPKKVGQELGVKAVLLTRLVRIGDSLTISPTLVRTRDSSQLWGERYSRKFDDVFAIEEDMASSIIQALRLKLGGEDKQKISGRPIDNAAAYESYLRARREIWLFREDALDRAVRDLQNGLSIGGDNPLLFSALAEAYFQYVNIGIKQEDYIAKAEDYANKALALDPDSAKAHVVLGLIYYFVDLRESIRHYKRALAIDPNEPVALRRLGLTYLDVGRLSAAVRVFERYKKADPLNPDNFFFQGASYFYDGQYRLALDQVRRWYQTDPANPVKGFVYAMVLARNKELDKAFSLIDQSARATPANALTKLGLLLKFGLLKDKEKAFQEMTPDFQKTCQRDCEWSYYVARALALLDAKEEAMDWLENAVNRGYINYPSMAEGDTFLQNIRGEERFKKLMKRVKYEWEHFEE